jgi:hypothetical protein
MVQPCISIKTLIVDNPFQRYETKPSNQLKNKIDQFESFGITPLQEMNEFIVFFHLVLMKHCCVLQNILKCETHSILTLLELHI